jgi:cytoskeleton protein RodZ
MTEVENVASAEAADNPTFGSRLAAERVRLGLSVAEMATRLRLHPRQIEAIEREALDRLPAGPFVRGFVRNYAKEVKLDPEPLLTELNRRLAPAEMQSAVASTASVPPSPSTPVTRAAQRERRSRRVVILAALAALLALAIIGSYGPRAPEPEVAPAQVEPTAVPATPESSVDATQTDTTAAVTAEVAPAPVEPVVAVELSAPVAPSRSSTLRLTFSGESWVEVTQADGRVLLSQLNPAGSEQRLDAVPPLKLVIGNAGDVAVEYRGKQIDLKPRTSAENVARLTLN